MAKRYLEKYGQAVLDNGYDICFIRPGEKRPFGKEWESKKHGPNAIASALENGRGGYGVGVKTKLTPGVDIDCYDEKLVRRMVAFTQELIGETIQRVGLAPKTLLVYRADKPFPKTQSRVFIDDEERQVKLEVLGDGQQFVAFHVHPDTEKPYEWVGDGESILDVAREDLPVIERDDALAIVEEFERLARKRGWPEKSTVKRLESGKGRNLDYDDPFITDKSKVDMTAEELLAKLQAVPNPEDYDTWFHVGMALHHQFDGSDEGLMMWHEWSAQGHNYDQDALDEKWPTFAIEGKKREPLTARFILKQAKQEEERLAGEELDEVKQEIKQASSLPEIRAVCDRIKRLAFEQLTRESLIAIVRDKIKKVSDTSMSPAAVRKLIAYENPEHRSTPVWMQDFVYCQHDETFYSRRTRQVLTAKAFDMSFGRYMMTKKDRLEGRSTPEHSASSAAVNRYQIPTVANRMYLPMDDEIFTVAGLDYVNSYTDANQPETPERLTKTGRKMANRIVAHLEHLFANQRDRDLLMSWLAYIVQTNKKVNWSPVVQGVENDGKSFFGRMMAAVLGSDNVETINGTALAENYTSWAENCQFLMVEEVRLHGANRFDVINKIKPYIANDTVPIRRMRADVYKVINTVNYFLTTNHKDGVPVNENSSRYFPMFSRWQTKLALAAFNKANPHYYRQLHEVLEHAGQLRRWLLDYELHKDFNPVERATESTSLREMIYLNQTDEEEGLAEILDNSDDLSVTRTLVDSSKLAEVMSDNGVAVPYGIAYKRMLSEAGFTYLGPVKVDGKTRKYWSQKPSMFMKNDQTDTDAIRDYLDPI